VLSHFEPVTQCVHVPALESALLSLPLAGSNQVFHAPRSLHGGRSAFSAAMVAGHAQLILALARNVQVGEFVLDWFSHRL